MKGDNQMGKLGYDLELLMGLLDSLDIDNRELVIDLVRGKTLGQSIVGQFKNGDARIRDVIEGNMVSGEDFFKEVAVTFDDKTKSKSIMVDDGTDSSVETVVSIKKTKSKSKGKKSKKTRSNGTKTIYVYKNDEYTSVASLARKVGMNQMTLYKRLDSGMSVKDAVETPVGSPVARDPIPVTFGGKPYESMSQLAREFSLKPGRLHYYAVSKGWGIDKAMDYLVKD